MRFNRDPVDSGVATLSDAEPETDMPVLVELGDFLVLADEVAKDPAALGAAVAIADTAQIRDPDDSDDVADAQPFPSRIALRVLRRDGFVSLHHIGNLSGRMRGENEFESGGAAATLHTLLA